MPVEIVRDAALGVFALLVVFAALRDLTSFTIPNWISALLAAAFIPAALVCGVGLPAILTSIGLGLVLLVLGMVLFALRWLGGGDAKLLAAASLWLGIPGLAPFVIFTGLSGGALALILLGLRSAWLRPFALSGPPWVGRLATPGEATPYGVAIAVGALAAFPAGLLMGGRLGPL
jgi:prepilin peptidase CpaA